MGVAIMGVAISSDDLPPPSINREVLLLLSVSSAATYAVCRASGPGHHHVVRIVHHLSRLSSVFPEEFHSGARELTSAPICVHLSCCVRCGSRFTSAHGCWVFRHHGWKYLTLTSLQSHPTSSARLSFCVLHSVWLVCLFSCPQPLTWLLQSFKVRSVKLPVFLFLKTVLALWGSFDILYEFYFLVRFFS